MQNFHMFSRISLMERLMFTKHLAIMIKSGVPIYESLETLSASTKSEAFKKVLVQIIRDVENGKALNQALDQHPKAFDKFYTSLVKVSEESGTLEETLNYLSEQLTKEYILRKKIQGAMFYPMIVFSTAIIIGSFISLYILPQLADFFENLDIPLPLPTRILLGFANLMKFQGIELIASLAVLFLFLRWIITTPMFKPLWQAFLIRLPIAGNLILYTQITRFTRNLSILMKSSIPVVRGLATSTDSISLISFRKHVKKIEEDLTRGKSISSSLEENQYAEFPPMVVKMIKIGEKTGTLESVLMYLSDFYSDEIDNTTKNLSNVLEPIMLIFIGLMVAFIAVAIIGPIYEVTGNVAG